ncbi:hypothetical protein F4778DRAFT_724959 [Xylariomycetidae sp. FL2044]|nr:hypothetical protein F4778DRAFT_724959 [Xylariomycetidae sp. FL2044]
MDYVPYPIKPDVKAHLALNCVVATLMVIIVSLRLWSRIYLKAGLGWDDAFIAFGAPIGIGMLVISGFWSQMGVGYNLMEVAANIGLILRLLFAYQLLYCLCISAAKLSVLFFYLRIFVEKKIRLVAKICIGVVVAGTLGNLLQPFLMCHPFRAIYDPTITNAKCGDELASLIAMGIFQVVTDVVIFCLPIISLSKLKMRLGKKLGLMGVFLVGFLTTLVGIIRLANLTTVQLVENLPGTMVIADFLTTLEPNLGLLCVSLPMLSGLFKSWFGRHGQTSLSYGSKQSGNTGERHHSNNRQKFHKMDDSIMMETVIDAHHNDTGSETELAPSSGIRVQRNVETQWS